MDIDEETFNYSDLEDNDMSEEPEETSVLMNLVDASDWAGCLARIQTHPAECREVQQEGQGRTPLHVACDNDAPAVVIQAMLRAYPEASMRVGTSNMNPLHITCSSPHASAHAVRALLEFGRFEQFSMRDVDGDTPLHAACRCGAPIEVLEILLRAYPTAVDMRDFEGLTPLLRLWVRYFVILGHDAIENLNSLTDLAGELLEAWNKTELLLRCAHLGTLELVVGPPSPQSRESAARQFRTLHAAAAVDCPRPILKLATKLYQNQLNERDEEGRTPLMIACMTPVYRVRDLTDAGYMLEDVIHGDENNSVNMEDQDQEQQQEQPEANNGEADQGQPQPSVIEILLQANEDVDTGRGARLMDPSGRLPLHMALETAKQWSQGIKCLVNAYPESVSIADRSSKLYPYQLGASDPSSAFELLRLNPTLLERHAARRKVARPRQDPTPDDGNKKPRAC